MDSFSRSTRLPSDFNIVVIAIEFKRLATCLSRIQIAGNIKKLRYINSMHRPNSSSQTNPEYIQVYMAKAHGDV